MIVFMGMYPFNISGYINTKSIRELTGVYIGEVFFNVGNEFYINKDLCKIIVIDDMGDCYLERHFLTHKNIESTYSREICQIYVKVLPKNKNYNCNYTFTLVDIKGIKEAMNLYGKSTDIEFMTNNLYSCMKSELILNPYMEDAIDQYEMNMKYSNHPVDIINWNLKREFNNTYGKELNLNSIIMDIEQQVEQLNKGMPLGGLTNALNDYFIAPSSIMFPNKLSRQLQMVNKSSISDLLNWKDSEPLHINKDPVFKVDYRNIPKLNFYSDWCDIIELCNECGASLYSDFKLEYISSTCTQCKFVDRYNLVQNKDENKIGTMRYIGMLLTNVFGQFHRALLIKSFNDEVYIEIERRGGDKVCYLFDITLTTMLSHNLVFSR